MLSDKVVEDLESLDMNDLIKRYAYIENMFFTIGILDQKLAYLVKYQLINDVKDIIYYNVSAYTKSFLNKRLEVVKQFLDNEVRAFLDNGPSTLDYQMSLQLKEDEVESGNSELRNFFDRAI